MRARLELVAAVCDAVHHAHQKGVIHRDLKPSNILVDTEGRARVTDFGLAKYLNNESELTTHGDVMGTPGYMSPEQLFGQSVDVRSDLYCLGIILHEMATGERPFAGDTFADVASSILKDTPVSVTERKADLPRDLGKLIKHCLEKEPRKRSQTTLDLANELEERRREVDSGEALQPSVCRAR